MDTDYSVDKWGGRGGGRKGSGWWPSVIVSTIKFLKEITPDTHKVCLASLPVLLDSGWRELPMLQVQHRQSFPLQREHPLLGGSLLALGRQDTAGSLLTAFCSRRALAGWTRISKKGSANCNPSWAEKKGTWLEETSGGFCVCLLHQYSFRVGEGCSQENE